MNVLGNGKEIVIDANTDDLEKAFELICVCGHRLIEHASPVFWYAPDPHHHTIYTRQCTHWKEGVMPVKFCCEQFQLEILK